MYGDESLFEWDAEAEVLGVTWDSEKSNSSFHRSLGLVLTEADAFAFTFDIALDEVKVGPSGRSTVYVRGGGGVG